LANDSHVNFRLATVNNADPSYANWKTVIEGSDDTYLEGVLTFNDFMILSQSKEAYQQIIVMDYDNNQHEIAFPEKMISVRPTGNYDFNQSYVRLNYESFLTPDTVFDYDTKSEELVTRKEKKIPSGYDKSKYETKRLMITTRDGVKVPVSLMYLKGTEFDGTNPMHMTGYGAYSIGYSTTFSTNRLSIVDRGVTYAIAHIRGGDDMGYQWYLDGKFKKRQNTFNDFVDVAKALIDDGYTAKRNLSISGRSAGGKLMGAVVVQAPELWSSVTLGVPFVDVINTIMDASLPLTPPEWEEWGNPIKSKEYFDYIMSYSPYDNIEARDYPPMMVTGGLNDPRVTYWEPAKWTAKMRHLKTDNNLLVMRMNMGAGHFANSGRYGRLKDYAQEYAFMLLSHGVSE
jgi:oligopeptidase B